MQETEVKHFANKITGWFFIRGSVNAFIADQLPKAEKWRLSEVDLPPHGGIALAWCPGVEGMVATPPIGSSLHIPYWSHKQRIDAVVISSTAVFLDI